MAAFKMPSLGADMEAGTLVEWLKQPGDEVKRGDIVAVVETEKGAIEVEIFQTGRIHQLLVEPGTRVPVGTPLALISGPEVEAEPTPLPPPVPAAKPEPAPAPLFVTAEPSTGPKISPAARLLAQERKLDASRLQGTGPGGAIVLADVEAAAAKRPAPQVDLTAMRHAIAAAMTRSKREIPHYYLSHSFDCSAAQAWLEQFNSRQLPEKRLLFGALLMKGVALALRQFQEFNGSFDAQQGWRPSKSIHVGMAISMRGGGLVAPAIHDADRLALPELMDKMRDLTGRVRAGSFRSSEISDPTVTVSSLGERGVDALWPVIYPPQVAIIGFGAVQHRPWAEGDAVAVRPILTASLAGDHRVNDGHRGALFLRRIAELLDRPEEL